jgi:hypothetical protein
VDFASELKALYDVVQHDFVFGASYWRFGDFTQSERQDEKTVRTRREALEPTSRLDFWDTGLLRPE